MTNRELIRYVLDYTMEWSIDQFEAIPDDLVWVPPRPNINAPGWTFGHVAVTDTHQTCHTLLSIAGSISSRSEGSNSHQKAAVSVSG